MVDLSFQDFYARFRKACARHKLKVRVLANGACIAEKRIKRGPRVAYLGGIHGEERSGPLALLEWLEKGKLPKRCSIWICPLINDLGWDRNKRHWGRINLNNMFVENGNNTPEFILQTMRSLRSFDPTVFIDLHEDITTNYPYLFRNIEDNAEFLIALQKKLGVKFEPWKGNEYNGASENYMRDRGCLASTTFEVPFIWNKTKKIEYHLKVVKTVNKLIAN